MKASSAAGLLAVPLFGVLIAALGEAMQGHSVNWVAVGAALAGLCQAVMPSVLLIFPGFRNAAVKGEMPTYSEVPPKP